MEFGRKFWIFWFPQSFFKFSWNFGFHFWKFGKTNTYFLSLLIGYGVELKFWIFECQHHFETFDSFKIDDMKYAILLHIKPIDIGRLSYAIKCIGENDPWKMISFFILKSRGSRAEDAEYRVQFPTKPINIGGFWFSTIFAS